MRFLTTTALLLSALLPSLISASALPAGDMIDPATDPDVTSTALDDILASLPEDTSPEELASIFNTYSGAAGNSTDGPHKRGQDLFCETGEKSPKVLHIHGAANLIIGKFKIQPGRVCRNTNPIGSKCTLYQVTGDAGLSVCSGGRPKGVKCTTVAWAGKHIANNCKNDKGRASGYYEFWDAGVRVVVWNAEGIKSW